MGTHVWCSAKTNGCAVSAKGSGSWPPVRRRRAARLVRAGFCCGAQRGGGGQVAAGPSNQDGCWGPLTPRAQPGAVHASKHVGALLHTCRVQPAWQAFKPADLPDAARQVHSMRHSLEARYYRTAKRSTHPHTCTSLTGRPGNRCCAAASASASSAPGIGTAGTLILAALYT